MADTTEQETSRTLDLDGKRMHYHDIGDGEPLVIPQAFGPLPGTTAWLTYHKVIADLVTRYRCILLDFPNFGRTSPAVFSEPVHDLYTRDAFAVMDALGLDSASIVGISTGGTVALDMALTAPQRVRRLVIGGCTASTGGDPPILAPFPSEVWRLFEECQAGKPDRDRIRRLLHAIVHDPGLILESLVDSMYEWRVREPEHAQAWSRSTSVPRSTLADLRTVEIPTLIVHGRFDRMVPLEQALVLLSHLPKADLVVLDNCGHWPAFEKPHEFARFVLPFLAE